MPIAGAFVRHFLTPARCPAHRLPGVLARAGLTLSDLADSGLRVSEQQFTRLLIALSRVTLDEFWGLASKPVPLGTFRTFCRLVTGCRTLGEALAVGGRFYRLVIQDFSLKTRCEDGRCHLWLKVHPDLTDALRRQEMEMAALFILYQLMCWLTDRRLTLDAVNFAHGKGPRSAEPLQAYDTATIRFNAHGSGFEFPSHLLALPVLADERRLRRFLSEQPHSMLVRFQDAHRLDDKVRAILRRHIGEHLELQQVAAQLHMTAVTLRRRLTQEFGLTYSDLRDQVRREIALDRVADSHAKLEAIAAELGFAEYSTFHRAFRRWMGISPSGHRSKMASTRHALASHGDEMGRR